MEAVEISSKEEQEETVERILQRKKGKCKPGEFALFIFLNPDTRKPK